MQSATEAGRTALLHLAAALSPSSPPAERLSDARWALLEALSLHGFSWSPGREGWEARTVVGRPLVELVRFDTRGEERDGHDLTIAQACSVAFIVLTSASPSFHDVEAAVSVAKRGTVVTLDEVEALIERTGQEAA